MPERTRVEIEFEVGTAEKAIALDQASGSRSFEQIVLEALVDWMKARSEASATDIDQKGAREAQNAYGTLIVRPSVMEAYLGSLGRYSTLYERLAQ